MAKSTSLTARTPALPEKRFPPLVVQELQTLEHDLGGRSQVVALLSLAPLTPDLRYILGLLGDPAHGADSLAAVCARGNVLPGELLKQIANAALLRGRVQAARYIGAGVAAVAQDVMRRAAPYEAPCNGGCQGTGSITPDPTPGVPNPRPTPCEVCKGTGRLVYEPDLDRQKLAVDLAQLLPKSAGINIAQINAPSGGGSPAGLGSLEAVQQLTDRILYGTGRSGGDGEEEDGDATLEGELADGSADQPPTEGPDPADRSDPTEGAAHAQPETE